MFFGFFLEILEFIEFLEHFGILPFFTKKSAVAISRDPVSSLPGAQFFIKMRAAPGRELDHSKLYVLLCCVCFFLFAPFFIFSDFDLTLKTSL